MCLLHYPRKIKFIHSFIHSLLIFFNLLNFRKFITFVLWCLLQPTKEGEHTKRSELVQAPVYTPDSLCLLQPPEIQRQTKYQLCVEFQFTSCVAGPSAGLRTYRRSAGAGSLWGCSFTRRLSISLLGRLNCNALFML